VALVADDEEAGAIELPVAAERVRALAADVVAQAKRGRGREQAAGLVEGADAAEADRH